LGARQQRSVASRAGAAAVASASPEREATPNIWVSNAQSAVV
jgi:hypothetical protein